MVVDLLKQAAPVFYRAGQHADMYVVVLLPDPLVFCVVYQELDVRRDPRWLDGREIDADDVGFFVRTSARISLRQ